MPKLIKDGNIIDNTWQRIDNPTSAAELPAGNLLLPLAFWLENQDALLDRQAEIGLTIANTDDLAVIGDQVNNFAVIELYFPAFMDGRGFSQGRLLRERYGFKGELRAGGQFIRDQLCYLRRCGFNAFGFDDEGIDLEQTKASLFDFTDGYQASVDQPEPLYLRR